MKYIKIRIKDADGHIRTGVSVPARISEERLGRHVRETLADAQERALHYGGPSIVTIVSDDISTRRQRRAR